MKIDRITEKFRQEATDVLRTLGDFESDYNELEVKSEAIYLTLSFDYMSDKYELIAATEIKGGKYRDYPIPKDDKLQIIANVKAIITTIYNDLQTEKDNEDDDEDTWSDFRELFGNPLYM